MKTFQLIKGTFTPEESKEVLLSLINNKINFHAVKCFSSTIRFGKPDVKSTLRIEELKQAREQIVSMIQEATTDHGCLKIEATIHVTTEAEALL